jgi:Type IV secretory pathway, VirB6 components
MAGAVVNSFEGLGTAYEEAAKAIIQSSIPALINSITPVITVGLALYVMITGYMVVAGRIQDPISDVLIKLSKWTIIAFIALNAGTVTTYLIGGFEGLESTILNAFGQSDSNVYQSLDKTLQDGLDVASKIQDQNENLGFFSEGQIIIRNILVSAMIMFAVILQTVLAGAIIILAKAALMVVFALAPLMLSGLFFPQTAKFADGWFNQAFNYTLTVVIAIFFQVISVTLFKNQIEAIVAAGIDMVSFKAIGKLIILAIVNFFSVKQSPSIAAGLAGGVSSGTASLVGAAKTMAGVGTGIGLVGGAGKAAISRTGRAVVSAAKETFLGIRPNSITGSTASSNAARANRAISKFKN